MHVKSFCDIQRIFFFALFVFAGFFVRAQNYTVNTTTFVATSGALSNITFVQASDIATANFTAGTTSGSMETNSVADNVSTLDVSAIATIEINPATYISTQPSPIGICGGSNSSATFTVAATNNGPFTYQWFKGGTLLSNGATGNGSTIVNATTAIITINGATAADVGNYYAVVTGTSAGVTSNNAALTLNVGPTYTTYPTQTEVCSGSTATFSCATSGTPTPTYQWSLGNTSLANGSTGNGSTISGATTSTLTITNIALADAATNYKVVATNSCSTATYSYLNLTVDASPAFITQPTANVTICAGTSASFAVVASGTAPFTYQWYKGNTQVANGTTSQGSVISGATMSTLIIANATPTDNASNYNVVIKNQCGQITSNNVSLIVSPPTLIANGSTNATNLISTNTAFVGTSCAGIAQVLPSGASPLSGNVTTTVTVDATVQTVPGGNPYVQRHYDIVPAANPTTATATITLYYSQTDFDNYNAFITKGGKLPTSPADAADIPNVRICQYHGTGTAPGNYSGGNVNIDPDDNNIVWNATFSRWEVTFNIVGFSGFYLTNTNTVLPLSLLSFTGTEQGNNAFLHWTTDNEITTDHFELQQSIDGVNFTAISKIATTGNNNSTTNNYQYIDKSGTAPVYYYQLKMVDIDGKYTLSGIVSILTGNVNYSTQVLPNPFQSELRVNINAPELAQTIIMLMDMSGKTLLVQNTTLVQGSNSITIGQLAKYAKGTYLLRISNNRMNQTIKVVKGQ